jgi:Cu2+-exporting ATPase
VEGVVRGRRYRLGQASFAEAGAAGTDGTLALADESGVVARFRCSDELRAGAATALAALRALGIAPEIASGDAPEAVVAAATRLGVARWQARMTPAEKLARLRELQAAGARVLVIGDGVNDAPLAGGADVSIVMRSGSALAQTSGDLLLLDDAWAALPRAVLVARRARAILRQNLAWAAAYNLLAIPVAALGWLPPWVSALGMSASSMLVVLNARRAAR